MGKILDMVDVEMTDKVFSQPRVRNTIEPFTFSKMDLKLSGKVEASTKCQGNLF